MILDNLLSNAVKYTAQGRVSLDAQADATALRLTVQDTARASRPTSWITCSTASTAPPASARRPSRAPAWAWRLWRRSFSRRAARSARSAPGMAMARRSRLRCRWAHQKPERPPQPGPLTAGARSGEIRPRLPSFSPSPRNGEGAGGWGFFGGQFRLRPPVCPRTARSLYANPAAMAHALSEPPATRHQSHELYLCIRCLVF